MNRSLFSALWLEKMAISITIGLIVMVAALNIVASLVLLVMEKSRDIAILKTMGSSAGEHPADLHAAGADHRPARHARRRDRRATRCIYVLDRYQLIHVPIDVYQISYVPFTLLPLDFADRDCGGARHLLRRDDLPVAPGVEARSGAGAAVPVSESSVQAGCIGAGHAAVHGRTGTSWTARMRRRHWTDCWHLAANRCLHRSLRRHKSYVGGTGCRC